MTDPATRPETRAEPQQPATAAHSDAQRQREQLRERIAKAIYGEGAFCGVCGYEGWDECPECRRTNFEYADAVLAVRDEELQRVNRDYLHAANRAEVERQRAEAAEQERDALREHVDADHQVLAQVRDMCHESGSVVAPDAVLAILNGDADE